MTSLAAPDVWCSTCGPPPAAGQPSTHWDPVQGTGSWRGDTTESHLASHLPPPISLALNGKRRLKKIRKVECSREDTTKIIQKGVDGFRPAKKGGEWPSQVLAPYSSQLRWQCGWGSWEPSKPGNKVPTGQWQQGESNGWDEGTEKIKPWSSSH